MRPAFPAGASTRRAARLTGLACATALTLVLAACAEDDDASDSTASGSAFSQALFKDYTDLAQQAETNPPADSDSDGGFFSFLDSAPDNPADTLFTEKAQLAAKGEEPQPEPALGNIATGLRTRLVAAVDAGKAQFPDLAARAQSDYDCWTVYAAIPSQSKLSGDCRTAFADSLVRLETSGRAPVPAPMPVTTAQVAPPPPAPVQMGDYTVYFDFDSWTLTAEDLTVLTQVINTARSGGQAHINVIGHTDTAGPDDYNQKLSVHRANVVVEALVDMGARRKAIHASGVGETDLAVQTPDGVKEAKNRRAVVTLQP